MAPLGPFERAPVVAAAVSGGADSLALSILAQGWARRRGGRLIALTVDHGLRTGSNEEARRVGDWLAQRGIAHHILRWRGEKPHRGVQAAAREARYRLLGGWCARHTLLHLLLAHHLEDQAETLLMRLARGSGVDGLSAMAALGGASGVRIVRPLLGTPRARLRATLRARRQTWIEDPSNRDPAFERVRVRRARGAIEAVGVTAPHLAKTARHMARARTALEAATTDLLARSAIIHSAGFCVLEPAPLAAAADEISLRALSRVLMCIAGADYPPRFERLARLQSAIAAGLGSARTLLRCRIAPYGGRILVCREAAAAAAAVDLAPGGHGRWDTRFTLGLAAAKDSWPRRDLVVARLGIPGWRQVVSACPETRESTLPAPVRAVLPALWHSGNVVSVPHLDFYRTPPTGRTRLRFTARFEPPQSLSPVFLALA